MKMAKKPELGPYRCCLIEPWRTHVMKTVTHPEMSGNVKWQGSSVKEVGNKAAS